MSQFQPPQPQTGPMPPMQPYPPQQPYYPPPPQPLPPAPPKRPRRSRVILIGVIAAVVVLAGLAVLIGQAKTPATQVGATPNVGATNTAESNAVNTADANASAELTAEAMTPTAPPVTPTPATAIGSTQDIGTWVVTLNKVYRATSSPYANPKSGDIFVVVDVTAINEAATPEPISSELSFVFQDETGQAYQEAITGIGVPPDGTVPAGGKLRGQISYEVPTSLHNFTLTFQDSVYKGNTGTWNFSV